MKRVIYSLYIDIPSEELDDQPPHWNSNIPKNEYAKSQFREYYDWLKHMHVEYAKKCGVEYKLFEYDQDYIDYKNWFNEKYPQIVSYNIVNFYKIHLLYKLSEEYDEIVYLDFDVVPLSDRNVFNYHDTNNGIHIMMTNDVGSPKNIHSNRSPTAKYWNARAMCMHEDLPSNHKVFNTGIIIANKQNLKQLGYYDNFNEVIQLMYDLIEDDMFDLKTREMFGYDNETIWAYKTIKNQVKCVNLQSNWHHFMDKWNYIPKGTDLVHVINKRFDYVKNWYEKTHL